MLGPTGMLRLFIIPEDEEYGRVAKCAFGAKVTKEYLNIVTGNRRFWRFPVTFLANFF